MEIHHSWQSGKVYLDVTVYLSQRTYDWTTFSGGRLDALKQAEQDTAVPELCHKLGIAEQSDSSVTNHLPK